jgi:exportin-T
LENLAGYDEDMVIAYAEKLVTSTLAQWQTLRFVDVEVAIYVLYLVGEAIPVSGGNHFTVSRVNSLLHLFGLTFLFKLLLLQI